MTPRPITHKVVSLHLVGRGTDYLCKMLAIAVVVDTMCSYAACHPTVSIVTTCSKLIAMLTALDSGVEVVVDSEVDIELDSEVDIELDNELNRA